MRLRLKEDPREWRKFGWMSALAVAVIATVFRWRGVLPARAWWAITFLLGFAAVLAALRPRWFRTPYRASTTFSFYIGRVVGFILLTVLFVLILTPLGWLLRLSGKDLLGLKRDRSGTTYWRTAQNSDRLDRMF